MNMTSRERVLCALGHNSPDRTPVDLGSSNVSSIHINAYQKLLDSLGIRDEHTKMMEHASQLVIPCDALLDRLHIDTRGVFLSPPKVNKTVFKDENEYTDVWGITYRRPVGGFYFDVTHSPLEEAETEEEVRQYRFPEVSELASDSGVTQRAKELRERTGCALVGSFGSSIFMRAQQVRGYSRLLEDMLVEKEQAEYLLDRICDLRMQLAGMLIDACGEELDIIEMADDIAGQNGLLISRALYCEMVKPRTQRLISFIKSKCGARILYHSCGNVFPILDDLLEIGVDILNPVQVSAGDMGDIQRLKRVYGDRLCFWGAIDSQHLLPNGSPEQVGAAVRNTVQILGRQGGYVLCASHNLQCDIPVNNILAMYDAADGLGREE